MKDKKQIIDTFDTKVSVDFCEANEVVDGKHVLAKVKGEFFCPNGISRNNRFYSKSLWENVLNKKHIQEKLERKIMFGTIGHKTPINDEAWQEGKITHFVNYLGINEDGKGIGEAYILDTPAGRNVNAVLRAGCEVFVSSRANGKFKGEKNGIPKVDENFFDLETFDFVLDPGFLQANPKLAESLTEIEDKDENLQGEKNMELNEKILNENIELKSEVKEALKENKELKDSLEAVTEDANQLKESVEKSEATITELTEKVEATEKELTEAKEVIAAYDELGDGPEDVREALERALEELEKYNEIGDGFDSIKEALEVASTELERFAKLGSYEVIEKVITKADEMIESKIQEEKEAMIEELASEYKVKNTVIESLIAKNFTKEEIVEHFEAINETKKKEEKFADNKEEEIVEEEKTIATKSRLSRLVEHFE